MFKNIPFKAGLVAVSIASMSTMAVAQETEVDEEMIVTGTAQPVTKLDSSSSVTALPAEEIKDFAPRSTAEIFRNLPGIQVEATGGDANANIKIRGLPISAGGARYLSIQEDGLPVLLIGDWDFATADSFVRFDTSIDSVQSIRGGSGATQASNAAGGIVNFINKTGTEEGGSVALNVGLDYSSNRVDLEYGKPLDNGWSYHVGGFLRSGEGPRETPTKAEEGYQIKANATKDFDNGSMTLSFKNLDDSAPTYLPVPATANGNGSFEERGVDFGDGTLILNGTDQLNRRGGVSSTDLGSGFQSEVTSFGIKGDIEVADGVTLRGNVRKADISGNFASPFPAQINGSSTRIHYFNTQINSMDNTFADLSASIDLGEATTLTAGVFSGSQDYDVEWGWNTYFVDTATLAPVNGPAGEPSFVGGHALWGQCCQRAYDLDVSNTGLYLNVNSQLTDALSLDAGVRKDDWETTGTFAEANGFAANGLVQYGANQNRNHEFDYNSFSAGLNYALTDDSNVFANISSGGSATAPSRLGNTIDIPEQGYNQVDQFDIGYKYRGDNASVYATLFFTDTEEAPGFEVTTQTLLENSYESKGLELEGDYDFGNGFSVKGSATFTDAEITVSSGESTGGNVGNQPRRQAPFIFNVTPTYTADNYTVGVNFVGTDEVYAGDSNEAQATFEGYTTANLFANYDVNANTSVSLNVNNLLDTEGFTEGEGGDFTAGTPIIVRPINGRTSSVNVTYRF